VRDSELEALQTKLRW